MLYSNIGDVHGKMREWPLAILFHEKALEIRKKNLQSNHPALASSYGHISFIYFKMEQYKNSLDSCTRAVKIGKMSLPTNHPDLQWYTRNLEFLKKIMNA
jgi:preprotein translocase subunit SecA/nephrocystin-3